MRGIQNCDPSVWAKQERGQMAETFPIFLFFSSSSVWIFTFRFYGVDSCIKKGEFTVTVMHHGIALQQALQGKLSILFTYNVKLPRTAAFCSLHKDVLLRMSCRSVSLTSQNCINTNDVISFSFTLRWTNWNAKVVKGSQSSYSRCAKGFL
jgi:hypothetical protein